MWNNWKIASKIGLKVVVSNSVHFELQHTNKTLKFILRNKQYLHEGHEFIRLQIKIFYLYNKFTGKIGIFRIFYCFFFLKDIRGDKQILWHFSIFMNKKNYINMSFYWAVYILLKYYCDFILERIQLGYSWTMKMTNHWNSSHGLSFFWILKRDKAI